MKEIILNFFESISEEKKAEILSQMEKSTYAHFSTIRIKNMIKPKGTKHTDTYLCSNIIRYLWRFGYINELPTNVERLSHYEKCILHDFTHISEDEKEEFYLNLADRIDSLQVAKFIESNGESLINAEDVYTVQRYVSEIRYNKYRVKKLPPLTSRQTELAKVPVAKEEIADPPVPDGVYGLYSLSKQLKKTQLEAAELLIWTLLQNPGSVNRLSLEELVEKFKKKKLKRNSLSYEN